MRNFLYILKVIEFYTENGRILWWVNNTRPPPKKPIEMKVKKRLPSGRESLKIIIKDFFFEIIRRIGGELEYKNVLNHLNK